MSPTQVLRAALDGKPVGALVASLKALDAGGRATVEERLVFAAIAEELEARHPEVGPAMDLWADEPDPTVSYAAALIAALPSGVI